MPMWRKEMTSMANRASPPVSPGAALRILRPAHEGDAAARTAAALRHRAYRARMRALRHAAPASLEMRVRRELAAHRATTPATRH